MWNGDEDTAYNMAICHAAMAHHHSSYTDLVTAVPDSSEVALEYLRMLVRGPFRSVSDLIKLDRVGSNYFLHCLRLDKWPANVLMNFCIASRVPIEFKYLLGPWAKRCEAGFDPVLAFLLTYSYGADLNNKPYQYRSFAFHKPGHLWFDPASNWSNLLNGVIEKASGSYYDFPQACRPTNVIWGHTKEYDLLKKMTDEEIAAYYTQAIEVYQKPEVPKAPKGYKLKPAMDIDAYHNFLQQGGLGNVAQPGIHDEVHINAAVPDAGAVMPWPFVNPLVQVLPDAPLPPDEEIDDDDDDEINGWDN